MCHFHFTTCRSRRKEDHVFLVAIYECYEYYALENAESNRLYCSKSEWIGTRPVCVRIEGTDGGDGDGDGDNGEPGDCKFGKLFCFWLKCGICCIFSHNRRLLRASKSCADHLILERKKKRKMLMFSFTQSPATWEFVVFTQRFGTPLHINLLIRILKC